MAERITKEVAGSAPTAPSQEQDCEKVVGVFEKWLEGKSTPEEEAFLAEQTDDCSPCFETIDQQQLFVEFLNASLPRPGMPASLIDSIKSKIQQTA